MKTDQVVTILLVILGVVFGAFVGGRRGLQRSHLGVHHHWRLHLQQQGVPLYPDSARGVIAMTCQVADPIEELLEALDPFTPYVVDVKDWKGWRKTACWSKEEVRTAIGNMVFGGLYQVYSPLGLPTDEFVPY